MATILKTKSIYFNDIIMLPKLGAVRSRKDVPDEKFRIIISPMSAVIGTAFIAEAAKLGLSVALPRFTTIENKVKLSSIFNKNKYNENQICFVAIGLNEKGEDLVKLVELSNSNNWLIDIANGYIPQLKSGIMKLDSILCERGIRLNNLMLGNVVTSEGIDYVIDCTKSYCQNLFIRIGIGNGRNCQTSDTSAINRGQITELIECSESLKYKQNQNNCFLVSDGGIDRGGFALKAWGAGADYVLMGGLFSNSLEAETNISGDGTYFGCASEKQNKLAGLDKHSEGKITQINKEELKPLAYIVKELWGGISSGISYSGYTSISKFIGNATFEVKINSLPPKKRI